MPTVAYFLGIAVLMYHREHGPPHIHVVYQGYEALLRIDEGSVLGGKLPPTVMRIMRESVDIRRHQLTENWQRARRHEVLERIAGLDDDHQGS